MLNVKVRTIFEALPVITAIIKERRPMGQAGKFRLARMHAVLLPEFEAINKQRDELIKSYGQRVMVSKGPTEEGQEPEMVPTDNYSVPMDKIDDFNTKWTEMMAEAVEVNINPIPISMLSPPNAENGSIEAAEIASLDELLTDLTDAERLGATESLQ